ncbi:MAG: hypothetical protein JWR60_4320, partial [Polaromonas sp.]|nr:hypothetical protein [Polaromonas sp.]
WADAQRALQLARGESFVSETVFSHASKLALIEEALARGYVVALYIVALDDPQRLLARVRRRVQEGGHDVPPAKTRRRRAAAGGDASGRESDGFCQAAAAVGARGAGEVEYDMFKAGKKAWEHYYRQGHATGFIAISLLYSLHKPENCFFKTSLDLENVHFTPCYFDNRIAGNLCRTVCAND